MANAFAPGETILPDSGSPLPAGMPSDSLVGPDKITSGLSDIQGEAGRAKEGIYHNIADAVSHDTYRTHKAFDAEAATAHDIPDWNEEQQHQKFATDPVKAFGSMGSVFALVAAAFTHRPMINALQGSAAAMDAIREGNEKDYDKAFQAYKTNTELAIKRHTMMHQEYEDANQLMRTDMAAGEALLKMTAMKYDDKQMQFLTENGLSDLRDKLLTGRAKAVEGLVKANDAIDSQSLRRQTFESMKADVEKSGIPKDDPRYATLMAEAGRRAFAGKETPMDAQMWQWEMQHAHDHDDKGPTAEERQKFYQGFRSTARETPDMEFLRKYQEEHPGESIQDAYTALTEAKNADKTNIAAAKQEEINRHNKAVEEISASKGDTSVKLAEEKQRHDITLENLQYGRLLETVRYNSVKAQTEDEKAAARDKVATAKQEEINRHNQAVETISSGRGDTSAKLAEEKERHDRALEKIGQERKATSGGEEAQAVEEMLKRNPDMSREDAIANVKAKIAKAVSTAKGGDALLNDDTVELMADQYMAGDKSVLQNLGRGAQGAQNIVKVREAVMRKAKEQGLKGPELALRMAEFSGVQAGERALGTRTANIEMFANETLNMIDVARKASIDVPRSQWIPVNKALQSFESNTGDPKIRAFGASLNSLINTYAKAIAGGGQATVSDKDHAREIITSADSQAQFDAVMNIIQKELQAARKAPGQVKEQFRDLAGTGGLDKPLAPEQNVIRYDINGKRIP